MTYKRYVVRTTHRQRERIASIRITLAGLGYNIYPVARTYRRHHLDFLAVKRSDLVTMLLVRPAKNEIIEVRPYWKGLTQFNLVRNVLKDKTKNFGKVHWKRELPKIRPTGWRSFMPHMCHLELKLFSELN